MVYRSRRNELLLVPRYRQPSLAKSSPSPYSPSLMSFDIVGGLLAVRCHVYFPFKMGPCLSSDGVSRLNHDLSYHLSQHLDIWPC